MEENYAVIEDGVVINVIVWDGITPYPIAEGQTVCKLDKEAWIGWKVRANVFYPPES